MGLKKLFESLDNKVFTDELKESLETSFNEAVESKAIILMDEKLEEKMDELEERADEHIKLLNEDKEKELNEAKEEISNNVNMYLDRVVDDFLEEVKTKLDESVLSEKADMIVEAFDSMLIATGVKVADIVEAKDNSNVSKQLEESKVKYDALVEEVFSLKNENEKLIVMGAIAEMSEDLSLVESEKFKKLAELVEFTNDSKYVEKLETIKESVQGTSKSEDNINENTDKDEPEADWKRFV